MPYLIDGDLSILTSLDGDMNIDESLEGEMGEIIPYNTAPVYRGEVSVIPSGQEQVLEVSGLLMPSNLIIEPIPNNYGLITWNGSILTVS